MNNKEILTGILIALVLGIFLSPFVSSWPDGLERVAQDLGFIERGEIRPIMSSPIPDYVWPGVKNEKIATSLAGFVGTLLVFVMGYGVAFIMKKLRKRSEF